MNFFFFFFTKSAVVDVTSTFAHFLNFVVVVLHARTAIYAFFALFGRCRFCFCFCSCFVVIGSVTNFYSVLVQYDGSLVWLFGFGNHLSLIFCDDGMPYLKTFQLHITGKYSSHLGNRRKKPLPEFPLHWHLL